MPVKQTFSLLKDSFTAWSADRAPRMGAALAYYVIFSIAPLLIIVIAVAGAIFGEQAAQGEIFAQLESTVGASAAESIQGMLANVASLGGANIVMMVVGGVVLLVGASGVFAELQDSLNTIFRVPAKEGTGIWNAIRRRFLSFAMVFGIGFMLLVSLVISAFLSALGKFITPESMPGGVYLWQGINLLVSLAFITVLFALIYKILPDDDLSWRDVFVGAALTSFLFAVGKFLLGLYLGYTSTASSFGAAGSLVVVLVWVYYSAQILLFGAEFTRLYSISRGSSQRERENQADPGQAAQSPPPESRDEMSRNGSDPKNRTPARSAGKSNRATR